MHTQTHTTHTHTAARLSGEGESESQLWLPISLMRRHEDERVCLGNLPSIYKLKKIKARSDWDSGSAMVNFRTWSQDISPFLLALVLETKGIPSSLYRESFSIGAPSRKLWFYSTRGLYQYAMGRERKSTLFIQDGSFPLGENFEWSNTTHTHRFWIISEEAICLLCSLKFVLLLGISVFFFPFHLQNISIEGSCTSWVSHPLLNIILS